MRIELPQVGESVTEGMIGKWLKSIGDRVEKYDALVEIVTDKVNMEFPSPTSGTLTAILAEEGDTVPMGSVIAEIAVEGEDSDESEVPPDSPDREAHTPEGPDRLGILVEDAVPVGPTGSGGVPQRTGESGAAGTPMTKKRYSPAVLRLADQHGIDLSQVEGTGIGGRIRLQDVRGFVASADITTTETNSEMSAADREGTEDEYRTLTPIRRMIAANMVRSASEIPQAWSMVEVDVTGLVGLRERLKDGFREKEEVNLTYLPFVVKATADCLKYHPLLNSSWDDDHVILRKNVNIGIAVSTPDGLIVPVIHNADGMDVASIARRIDSLVTSARQGSLDIPDVQNGTFTVNNTGALGSVVSRPLINPPQAAILATEAIVKRPVVINDAIAVRSMMNLGLTFDHRIMDGAEAGAFLADLKSRLQSIGDDHQIWG